MGIFECTYNTNVPLFAVPLFANVPLFGIGHKRKAYMNLVMSEAHLDMMRSIKRALDPKNILNPRKIFS
ncbi:MAG: FAD-linked oxidase C-terminal domain-containing protein [Nitrospinales bacterium]